MRAGRPVLVGSALLAIAALSLASGAGTGRAQDRSEELPPPALTALLRFVVPALEKPAVPMPKVDYPASPVTLPELPAPRVAADWGSRPVAPLAAPRVMACNPLGSVFGVASEMLECAKARYQRGELQQARADFTGALQKSTERQVVREARYWLAETQLRLGRTENVERHLTLVVQDDPRGDLGPYAAHTLGWLLIDQGDPARALSTFEPLLRGGAPPDLIPSLRHGRARALYGLKRYADARQEWTALLGQSIPRPLATEVSFWLGETLGRLGDAGLATRYLQVFTAAGAHPLTETALLRLGWWRREAGQPLEAIKVYRGLLSAYPQTAEQGWVRVGLAQALIDVDDVAAAREEIRQLEARDRSGSLTLPALIAAARLLTTKARTDDALALQQELLALPLEPAMRAYVLLLQADTQRQAGQAAEARTQLELVRGAPGQAIYGLHAALRLAQLDFEQRDFGRAQAAAEGLLGESTPRDLSAAALVVAGESAYWGRQYERAAAHYGRFLSAHRESAEAPVVTLALGWAEFRRGRLDTARQVWSAFARDRASDPRVPAALLLSAELAAQAGDERGARAALDQLLSRFPDHELASAAVVNRAVLALRAGRSADGLRDLGGPAARAATPYLARVRLVRGVALIETRRPDEARSEFGAALAGGEEGARLGLGRIAFERRQWDEAIREFAAARDAGGSGVAAAAEYGLAAALFNQGKKAEFAKLAGPLVSAKPDAATTPHLLAAMAGLSADEKKWTVAQASTRRLVSEFPDSPVTASALLRLATAATRQRQWPLAREAYQTLVDRYPKSPVVSAAEPVQVDFAEALLRTGAAAEARQRLEGFVGASPKDREAQRALLLLAEAREAQGERAAALEIYTRLRQDYPSAPGTDAATLAQGRLFLADGKWDQARPLLERAAQASDPAVSAEAAYRLGEGFRAANQHQDAVDQYMTAAYAAPDSPWGRRALLGAGQSFMALRQKESAEIVYRKILATKDVEPELADAARKELRALGAR